VPVNYGVRGGQTLRFAANELVPEQEGNAKVEEDTSENENLIQLL
jgi:hypothetical protein